VLLPETPFFSSGRVAVKGIVESGVQLLLRELRSAPKSVAMIFGTETTIEAGTYPRLLEERAVEPSRIVSQECPGLASTISRDREGSRTADEIRRCVRAATQKLEDRSAPAFAYLACTHYGYRRELFASALAEEGIEATVLNPNELAVDDLFGTATGDSSITEVEVQFYTRYAIPEATIETLTYFLDDISPRTVAAMRNFVHDPELF
jgi:glutamate racemase